VSDLGEQVLHDNAKASEIIATEVLGHLHDLIEGGQHLTQAKGSMQYGVVTKKEAWPESKKKELSVILPYFKD
jgi:5'-methylthioadenosine phosphorylase